MLRPLCFQWERITASRIAIVYLAFSVLNCGLQVVFQAQALSINIKADHSLSGLIRKGNLSYPPGFFVLDSKLHFCDHVPRNFSTESCLVVWDGEISDNKSTESVTSPTPTATPTANVTPTADAFIKHVDPQLPHDNRSQLNVGGYRRTPSDGQPGEDITVDDNCLVALKWPVQT